MAWSANRVPHGFAGNDYGLIALRLVIAGGVDGDGGGHVDGYAVPKIGAVLPGGDCGHGGLAQCRVAADDAQGLDRAASGDDGLDDDRPIGSRGEDGHA